MEKLITIEAHILAEQTAFPDASGKLTHLLYDIALAGKLVARKMNRAGLADILGEVGKENVQGERVKKLDEYANDIILQLIKTSGRVVVAGSEEMEDAISMTGGKYVLLFDPLDGSSNIDFNVSIGTVFSIYRRKSESGPGLLSDCLQAGTELVAAGYMLYGSSTLLVYSTGNGVNGFTLDPSIGEFLLSHKNIKLPDPKYFSVNLAYKARWSSGVREYARWLRRDAIKDGLSLRYIGSMVADVHRTLLGGGVFFYPKDTKSPKGKLRLLYEAIPMAYLIEQAGGKSSDGEKSILEIIPEKLHERVPLFIGETRLVEKAEALIAELG